MTTKPTNQQRVASLKQALNNADFQPAREKFLRLEIFSAAKRLRESDRENAPDKAARLQSLIAELLQAIEEPLICPTCGQGVANHES